MKPDAYQRNIAARAFDVARYALFFGIPTGVGQVTSIRTLERQIRRLKASEYAEVRELAEEIAAACAAPPACVWDAELPTEPLAPTLARHVDPDEHAGAIAPDLAAWAAQNLPPAAAGASEAVRSARAARHARRYRRDAALSGHAIVPFASCMRLRRGWTRGASQ